MSWTTLRAELESDIEALTPTTADLGSPTYRHVNRKQIENSAVDRNFAVRMTNPPALLGHVYRASVERYKTGVEITIRYIRTRNVQGDEDRIAEDVEQIQTWLANPANTSTAFYFFDQGDTYFATELEEDEERNYYAYLRFTVHHQ